MAAATHIPNFNAEVSSNPRTLAFYLAAGTYKMLKKTIEVDHKHDHQIDAYLLLLSMTLPDASSDALVKGGILR
jgi:Iap family predicted aminopeptidase